MSVEKSAANAIGSLWSEIVGDNAMKTLLLVTLLGLLVFGVVYRLSIIAAFHSNSAIDCLGPQLSKDQAVAAISVRENELDIIYHDRERAADSLVVQASPKSRIEVHAWDTNAAVYVTVGADGGPGAVEVDDDGNGIVDDRRELGATGSDDQVLTPDDAGYDAAASGAVTVAILSQGAMRKLTGDGVIQGPGQARIDCLDERGRLTSRIVDLVK